MPLVGTATLAERAAPYVLAVELARGKLNDIRNQLADWLQLGLRSTPPLDQALAERREHLSSPPPAPIARGVRAGCAGVARRRNGGRRSADGRVHVADPPEPPLVHFSPAHPFRLRYRGSSAEGTWGADWTGCFNMAQLRMSWKDIAPSEGQYRWDALDSLLSWSRRSGLAFEVGPLVEFRYGALPDWLSLWEGDCETISGLLADFVQQAVTRYRGRVPLWHLVHRPASADILGLTEEEQIRITARAIQVAPRQTPVRSFQSASTAPGPTGWDRATSSSGPCTSATISSVRTSGYRPSRSRLHRGFRRREATCATSSSFPSCSTCIRC